MSAKQISTLVRQSKHREISVLFQVHSDTLKQQQSPRKSRPSMTLHKDRHYCFSNWSAGVDCLTKYIELEDQKLQNPKSAIKNLGKWSSDDSRNMILFRELRKKLELHRKKKKEGQILLTLQRNLVEKKFLSETELVHVLCLFYEHV